MRRICLVALVTCAAGAWAGSGEWTRIDVPGARVFDVEYLGNGAALAVTTGGVYRTTNHGGSWTRVVDEPHASIHHVPTIAVNPADPRQVLVGSFFLRRSADGGQSFQTVNPPGFNGEGYAVFSQDGFYAFHVDTDGRVSRSTDGGSTWTVGVGTVAATDYMDLDTDVTDRSTLYLSDGGTPYISRDAGVTWTLHAQPRIFFSPSASRTTSGVLLSVDSQSFVPSRSLDYGSTWVSRQDPTDIFVLGTGPGGRAIASSFDAHVFTSTNDGLDWMDRGRVPNGHALGFSHDPADPRYLLAVTNGGIIGSNDGGSTWEERNAGLSDAPIFDFAVARDGSNAVYVASADLASIYRRNATDGSFTGVGHDSVPLLGYPAQQVFLVEYRIAVAPQDGDRLYMMRERFFGRSDDGGSSWTRLSEPGLLSTLAIDPSNPLVMYAAGAAGYLKSVDGGLTWSSPTSASPLPEAPQHLLVDPSNGAILYAVVAPLGAVAIYRSDDGGVSWTRAGSPGPDISVGYALVFEPGRPTTLYLATDDGLFKSVNSGADWNKLQFMSAVPLASALDVVVDPQNPQIVYVASPSDSPMRSVDGGATWMPTAPFSMSLPYHGFREIALVPGHNAKLIGAARYGGIGELDVATQLSLSVTPATLTAGTAGSFTLGIRNTGIAAATRVRVTATLPAAAGSYALQGSVGGCAVAARELSCEVGTLAPNAEVGVTVAFTPSGAGSATFTATAYENLLAPATRNLTVQAAGSSSSSGGGGGGGGGRLDYLLLGLLAAAWLRHAAVRRR